MSITVRFLLLSGLLEQGSTLRYFKSFEQFFLHMARSLTLLHQDFL